MQALQINGTKVYCFDPKYKKLMLMGHKVGDTFFKTVDHRHYMVVVGGYGLQYDAFINFEKAGIQKIEILERQHDKKWLSRPADWAEHGKVADYGRGKQIFLSLKYMTSRDRKKEEWERKQREIDRARINQKRLL